MKIAAIITNKNNVYNKLYSPKEKENKFIKDVSYNPAYYKPQNISFKGRVFESYFPSDIIGMEEADFDKLILKTIQDKDTRKRDALANYIVKTVAKKANAMDFVNMWKRQVPTLVTPGMISIGGSSNSAAVSKALNITARNASNSMIDKFYASDFQTEVLIKDGKNATGGLLAYKLFAMASADPEPYSKAALYAAGLAVSIGTYALNRKESKKIQDMQFLNAAKECMRLGTLDPYLLLEKIDNDLGRNIDKNKYIEWLNKRLEDTRFIKTGQKINKRSDFSSGEAQNILKMFVATLSGKEINLEFEHIMYILTLMAKVYKSANEKFSAKDIMIFVKDSMENLFNDDENKYLNYKPLYDTYTDLALQHKDCEEYGNAINSLLQAEQVAINCFGENSQQVLDTNLRILDYIQERKKYNDAILPFIEAEADVSQSSNRKNHHESMAEQLKEYNTEEENSFEIKDLDDYKYNQKDSAVRVIKRILSLIENNPKFGTQFEKLYEIIEKYPNRKIYTVLMDNVKQLGNDSNLPQVIQKQLPILYKESQGITPDNRLLINKIFLYSMLSGITNFREVEKEILKANGNNPDIKEMLYNYIVKKTDYSEIEDQILRLYRKDSDNSNKYTEEYAQFLEEISKEPPDEYAKLIKEYPPEYVTEPDEYCDYLKVLYDWKYHFDSERHLFDGNDYTPIYDNLLNSRLQIMEDKYGYNSDKTMQALIDCIKSPMYYRTSDELLTNFIQNANNEMKKKYSAQIYEAHADSLYRRLKRSDNIDDTEATEGVISYKSAIENSKNQNPLLIYKYMNFIDFLHTRQIRNSVEGYTFGLTFNSTYDTPIIREINGMERKQGERELSKGNYSWSWVKDELQELVKSCPGPFRINERKFLQMNKKYETVWFQNRFNNQMESQIAQIEGTIGQYETK